MKGSPAQIQAAIKNPRTDIRLYLFLGPDDAGNAQLAKDLAAGFGPDFERIDISGSKLREDPALLADEASSLSLFGGGRYIFVTTSGEESLAAVQNLLAAPSIVNPVIIMASAISEKSRIAKAVIAAKNAYSIHSYLPTAANMAVTIGQLAKPMGLELSDELATKISENSAQNRRLAELELERLALYLDASPDNPRTVTSEALAALGAANDDDAMAPIINAALCGNIDALRVQMRRMREQRVSEVGLVIVMQRHVMQLAGLAAKMGPRGNAEAVVNSGRVFGDKAAFKIQLMRWPSPAIARLSERLLNLQQAMMKSSPGPQLLLQQELLEIARVAARRA